MVAFTYSNPRSDNSVQLAAKLMKERATNLSLWQSLVSFVCRLTLGSWKSQDLIELMNAQAQRATDIKWNMSTFDRLHHLFLISLFFLVLLTAPISNLNSGNHSSPI